jgi:hypothetical protein
MCDCINECDLIVFTSSLSMSHLSTQDILTNLTSSSDILARFQKAMEILNHVDDFSMIKTLSLLNDVSEGHDQLQNLIDLQVVGRDTSLPSQLSDLWSNLVTFIQRHIDDSLAMLSQLNNIYTAEFESLVSYKCLQLQNTADLLMSVEFMILQKLTDTSGSYYVDQEQIDKLLSQLIRIKYLLEYKAHYTPKTGFPVHLPASDECLSVYKGLVGDSNINIGMLSATADGLNTLSLNDTTPPDLNVITVLSKIKETRYLVHNMTACLLTYENDLSSFQSWLESQAVQLSDSFVLVPSFALLNLFYADGQLLSGLLTNFRSSVLIKSVLPTSI